jgi:hypothetical protein
MTVAENTDENTGENTIEQLVRWWLTPPDQRLPSFDLVATFDGSIVEGSRPQVLVTCWAENGRVDVAMRDHPGDVWSPPTEGVVA